MIRLTKTAPSEHGRICYELYYDNKLLGLIRRGYARTWHAEVSEANSSEWGVERCVVPTLNGDLQLVFGDVGYKRRQEAIDLLLAWHERPQ